MYLSKGFIFARKLRYVRRMPKGRPAAQTRPTLGENIARARQVAGLTQSQLAAALGVTQRVVTYWEREAESIQAEQLTKLADLLRVSVDDLLGRGQSPDRKAKQALDLIEGLPAKQQRDVIKAVEALAAKRDGKRK